MPASAAGSISVSSSRRTVSSSKLSSLFSKSKFAISRSSSFSFGLAGIGFVKGGLEKWKDITLVGADPVRDKQMEIKVVSPHMIDPEGKRMYA